MTNKEIGKALSLTAKLMELHDGNPFKIKSVQNAAFRIERYPQQIEQLGEEQLENIQGVGKSIQSKITELLSSGTTQELDTLLADTPKGVIEMLNIKGIGPKKIRQIWKDMEIESVGELLYACNENRLVELKGFGQKTQDQIIKAIEYIQSNAGKFHYAKLEPLALKLVDALGKMAGVERASLTGEMRRKAQIVGQIDILVAVSPAFDLDTSLSFLGLNISNVETTDNRTVFTIDEILQCVLYTCTTSNFEFELFTTTGSHAHLELLGEVKPASTEEEVYKNAGWPYIIPELREGKFEEKFKDVDPTQFITWEGIKGTLHNHSTYSDGANTVEEMAKQCIDLGLEYLGMNDHSQYAFYANGLTPERVAEQQKEIDALNEKLKPFKIFKGIEADILPDGSLDYDEGVLKTFDFVVASVHAVLKMDMEKANARLIKAIENPYTTILGHPTGRLLLSRPGYPIDHKLIIDACAANNVILELNANPFRLDIDWEWIPYAMDKGVMVSINPDAHKKETFVDMQYGIHVARKGGLTKDMTFNALSLEEIEKYFAEIKSKKGI